MKIHNQARELQSGAPIESKKPLPHLSPASAISMLIVLTLINILNFLDRQLPFILAESIKRDLDLSDTQLGLLGGLAFALCYSTLALPLGRLADRWSPKLVLAGCVLVWSAMTAAGGLARNFGQLVTARFGVAVGEAGCMPAAHALIAQGISPARRGLALGIFSMGVPIGTMLGLVLGGWINDNADWRTALLGAGAVGFFFIVLLLFLVPDVRAVNETRVRQPLSSALRPLWTSRAFRTLFVGTCLIGSSIYATLSFAAPYFIRIHGLTATEAGLALGLTQGILGVIGSIAGGRIFDRAAIGGHRNALLAPGLAFLLAAPAAAIAWFAPGKEVAIVFLALPLFAYVFYIPAAFGMAHVVAGKGNEAVASSVILIGVGLLGASFGPLVVGILSDAFAPIFGVAGLRWALLYVALANLLAGIVLLIANRRFASA
ncbi:spinster family MFS transporter [Sphingobium phenoxybenzoativorans]|uniref:spinster family MFS transporter n=1 Tax=Sphingobium phenoxybenzoativorans TaxID=1592790 RepID=UPI00209AD179|nr:MFS transporter [Sphingobium phenoxybenzoativorans]